jgi:Ni,Fe-hydrogenase maturation factor
MNGAGFWPEMERRGPGTVRVGGVAVGAGSRVRLWPRSRADIFDLAAEGRVAIVESVEQDADGAFHLAVTLEDDPGRDLGEARLPGHRFFYSLDEVEPLTSADGSAGGPRVLVAGIGNIFSGDDGFGVEVARRLAGRPAPPGVDIIDFGIRGMDLAHALQRGYDTAIFVEAARRGRPPGTLTVLRLTTPVDNPVDKSVDKCPSAVDRPVDNAVDSAAEPVDNFSPTAIGLGIDRGFGPDAGRGDGHGEGRRAGHADGPAVGSAIDRGADRGADHGVDHRVDRGVDRRTDRGADRRTDHGVDRRTDHGVDRGADRVDRGVGYGMDPLTVLAFARDLGRVPDKVLLLCCEPAAVPEGEPGENVLLGLSAPARAALAEAERKVTELVAEALNMATGRAARGTGDEPVRGAGGVQAAGGNRRGGGIRGGGIRGDRGESRGGETA